MMMKSIRRFSFAVVLMASTQALAALGDAQEQAVEQEQAQIVADISATEKVDLEIQVLAPAEAADYMKAAQLTDDMLERQGRLLEAQAGREVQAADGPFGFFSDIFSGNSANTQQQAYGRGRRGRHARRAAQPAATSDEGDYSWFGGGGGTCSARSGIASYYGSELAGHRTASGARFNPGAMTAAHRTLRFGTRVRVSHGGRSVVVTINDRGPFVGGRVIDLSHAAARALGLSTGYVTLQVLGCR